MAGGRARSAPPRWSSSPPWPLTGRGIRLGRGAGFYDRSLPMANRRARLVAMVRDDEVLDGLPGEPHDVPMTHALTPGRGLIALAAPPGMARPT